MCGIAGLFDIKWPRPIDSGLLRRMTDAIAHRGPDGEGHYIKPGVGLGHRRLAIIDLAGGAQPMATPDGALVVTFNGEIYNFAELRAQLTAKGARFTTRSDTEVLLHGWRIWGEALLPRLEGMFAFALWDAKAGALILARDRFGKKPLHYTVQPDGRLIFASEIKALLCAPDVPRDLDMTAVEDFFTYGYVPDPKTIYRAVRKLEPGHFLRCRRGGEVEVRRYWSVLDRLGASQGETERELVERLEHAVRRRLVADVPVGALLSGGVDSSVVVALASGLSSEPLQAFSIGFDSPDVDETAYARLVADRFGADHDIRQVNAADFSLLHRLPQIYDEPFGDVSAIPTFAVCAQAARRVKVALSGDGGDEVLGGYRRYRFQAAGDRVRSALPHALRAAVFAPLAAIYPRGSWLPRPLRAKTTLQELSLDAAGAYARMVSALPQDVRAALLTRDFRDGLAGYDSSEVVRAPFNVDAPLAPLQRAQYADMTTYLPGDILTKVDRASMANSLELRSPMLDGDFAPWAFGLPTGLKLDPQAGGKAILKRAFEDRLPPELLYRQKQGFTVPLAAWFKGPLRREILALADNRRLQESGVVDTGRLRAMAQGHVAGRADHSKALWLAWVFNAFVSQAETGADAGGAASDQTREQVDDGPAARGHHDPRSYAEA